MELTHFNDLPEAEAIEVVSVWARVPAWAEAVAGTRPFASVDELEATADRLARSWGRPELDAALAHHPRIGERPSGLRIPDCCANASECSTAPAAWHRTW